MRDEFRLHYGKYLTVFPVWLARLVVLSLVLAYAAGYAWSTPHTDTADELLRAYEIRHGLAYPVEGPFLGGALHLGPAWFYLTALPLWISDSWLAATLFIGVVCGLKFPLAYLCGRRLVDRDFGVLWALAMFVPGWTTLEQLLFLNPNAVGAATLLPLAIALHGLAGRLRALTFAALGLAFALAIHVHPTSAPILLLGPYLLWVHARRGDSVVAAIAAMAAGFILPFLPYLVSQATGGFSDWGSASTYMARQVSVANVVNVPAILVNYLFTGPDVIAEYLMGWHPRPAQALGIALGGLTFVSLAALVSFRAAPRGLLHLLIFAAALLVFTAGVACLRPTTPFQFTYVLGPAVAGLTAVGLWTLLRMAPFRPFVVGLVVALVAVNLLAMRGVAYAVREGEGRLPSLVMDIKGPVPPSVHRDIWFPAHAHDDLGRMLCAAREPVHVHGHLAYLVDKDLGLDTLFACDDRARLVLAGAGEGSHVFGMTRPFWRAVDAAPRCWIGSLGIVEDGAALLPAQGIAVADGSTYLPRKSTRQVPISVDLAVTASKDRAVLVTNMLGAYEYFRIESATAGGVAVNPALANDRSSLFRAAPGTADAVEWSFRILTTHPEAIDVHAFGTATRGQAGPCGP
jgi:hypothetical protein